MPGVLDELTTVVEDPGPWSIMIYGAEGARKTVMSAYARNSLYCDCEKSRRSLLNHKELWDIPLLKVESLAKLKALTETLIRNTDERIKETETVIVDTINELQDRDMGFLMKDFGKPGPNKGRDPDLPSQAEFNKSNRRFAAWARSFCSLTGRNLILLAHTREEKDDEGSTTLIRPGTSPTLAQTLARLVDGVFYMEYVVDSKGETQKWELRTVATKKIKGKSRFGTLPPVISNPTIAMIEEAADKQRQMALDALAQKMES